jgi:polyisoprenoid-binding protein YceI
MRKRFILATALPFALIAGAGTLAAQSAPSLPGVADASRVTSGTYAPDAGHTLVGWKVDHFGFNDYFGQFGNATGTLVLNKENPAASTVDITIPVNSLSTVSAGLNRHMATADFLNAANHPTARFVSRTVTVDGNQATILGDLTLRGVTRPVTLNARFVGAGTNPMNRKETVGFHATTSVNRSEFGMNYAVPMVSDKVELTISVAFEKQ